MDARLVFLPTLLLIYYAVKLELRRSNVSRELWVPFLWIVGAGHPSRSPTGWPYFQGAGKVIESEAAYLEGSPYDRMFLLAIMAAAVFILVKRGVPWGGWIQKNFLLVFFFAFCGLSIFWSDFPGISFRRWVKGGGTLIVALVVLTDKRPFESTKVLLRLCGYVLIPLSIVLIRFFPEIGAVWTVWGKGPLPAGVATNKNSLDGSACSALSGSSPVSRVGRRPRRETVRTG